MARPRSEIRKERVQLNLPELLAARLELEAYDPITQGTNYGTKADIVSEALRKYYADRERRMREHFTNAEPEGAKAA